MIYAAALAEGKHPSTSVQDEPMDNRSVMIGGQEGILGEWGMETPSPRYEGRITSRRALASSKIAASVRLGREVGLEKVAEQARQFGLPIDSEELFNRLLLGWDAVSLREMVRGYTALARGGRLPRTLRFIERIENADGDVVYRSPVAEPASGSSQACSLESSYQVHSMLKDVLKSGNLAEDAPGLVEHPFHGIAKTGTTHSFSDGWCVGYNGSVSLGVWVGFHQGHNRAIHENAFGRTLAFRPWMEVMNRAAEAYPGREVERPATLESVTVCGKSGLLATRYCYERVADGAHGESLRYTGYQEDLPVDREKFGLCDVHGRGGVGTDQILAQYGPEGGHAGRSQQVTVSPIHPKAPALLGDDPYNSEVVELAEEDEEVDLFVRGDGLSLDFIVQGEDESDLRLRRPKKIVIETD